jgi:hypothetical protein
MRRALSLSLLLLLAAAPAAAFPGGNVFTGKVKCITFYNSGSSGPVPLTDTVTLVFTANVTDTTEQTGTVELSHTEGSASGLQLDDADFPYRAFTNDSNVGLVTFHDDSLEFAGAIAEFKRKSDGSVSSLRIVFTYSDDSSTAQRCTGTLKGSPVT